MGRAPCCDKQGLKKGPWTPDEDQKLVAYIQRNGHGSWRALPKHAGLLRCGKSCRLRWTNYLRPDIKRGRFTVEEEQLIIHLHAILGNRWSAIAAHLAGRTDNEIKNYWNTHLKKRLLHMGIDPVTHKATQSPPLLCSRLSHLAQWDSARMEAEARLVRGPSPDSFLRSMKSQTNQTTRGDFPSLHLPSFTGSRAQPRAPFTAAEPITRVKASTSSTRSTGPPSFEAAGAALLLNHLSCSSMPPLPSAMENASLSPTSTLRTYDAQDSPYGTPDSLAHSEALLQCEKIMHGDAITNSLASNYTPCDGILTGDSLSSALLSAYSKPCQRNIENDPMSNTLASALQNCGLIPTDASMFQGNMFTADHGHAQTGMWEPPLVQLDSPSLSDDDMGGCSALGDDECSSSYSMLHVPGGMASSLLFDLGVERTMETQRPEANASSWLPLGVDANSVMTCQKSETNTTWQDVSPLPTSDYWSNMLKLVGHPGLEHQVSSLPMQRC